MVHMSTDEVYGGNTSADWLRPGNPYAVSKAASELTIDMLRNMYSLDAVVLHGCNVFGPRQHPEKFIPTVIRCIHDGKPVPLYGDGMQARYWAYVECAAARIEAEDNVAGDFYRNMEVVSKISKIMGKKAFVDLVPDRVGHDRIYPELFADRPCGGDFYERLEETVEWYVNNMDWVKRRIGE